MRRLTRALLVLAFATPARAHGTLPGGGGFYAGAAHPFFAWEHLLLLLAFGLLLGRAAMPNRGALAALLLALIAGLGLEVQGFSLAVVPILILVIGVAAGIAVAAALPFSGTAARASAAMIGLCVGLDTGVPIPSGGVNALTWMACAGAVVGIFLIVLNAMALASLASRPPLPIAVRIVGSWVAAACIMVLALEIRRRSGIA